MKKIINLVILMMTLCMQVLAQNYLELSITAFDDGTTRRYCNTIDSIRINQVGGCDSNANWLVFDEYVGNVFFEGEADHVTVTPEMCSTIEINYSDCNFSRWFIIEFFSFENIIEPWTEDTRWLARGETLELDAYYSENLRRYFVTGPETSGNIWCLMYNDCGAESDTINVYYNPEPSTVSVDPNTGHIIVSWEVNPTMVTYLQYVYIYRDGFPDPVAIVPYGAGEWEDEEVDGNIASRYYAFKGVAYDGSTCPWYSESKPSIHADYTLGAISDDVIILFNDVSNKYVDLYVYYISELLEGDEVNHIDSLGVRRKRNGTIDIVFNSNNRFTVNNRDGTIQYRAPAFYFNPDRYLIVDSGFIGDDKRDDRKLRSNKSEGTVSVKAFFEVKCSLFPNPATHQFTVMGLETGTLTLYNQLGQVILTQEISGETTIKVEDLIPNIYFARISTPLGVCTKKVVVK